MDNSCYLYLLRFTNLMSYPRTSRISLTSSYLIVFVLNFLDKLFMLRLRFLFSFKSLATFVIVVASYANVDFNSSYILIITLYAVLQKLALHKYIRACIHHFSIIIIIFIKKH